MLGRRKMVLAVCRQGPDRYISIYKIGWACIGLGKDAVFTIKHVSYFEPIASSVSRIEQLARQKCKRFGINPTQVEGL